MTIIATRVTTVGSAFAAFIRRDFLTALSYRLPFALDVFSSIVQLVLFFFLGRIVDQGNLTGAARLQGGYFSFVVIGLVMTRIIETALRSFSDKLRTEQTIGTFEALIATPASLPILVLGSAGYNLLYGMVSGVVMLILAVGLGLAFDISLLSGVAGLVSFLASMAFFAAIGVAVAAFIVVFKQGSAVLGMATQLLALLGGVYFPIEVFPAPLRVVAQANPLTWSLSALRAALLDGVVLWPALTALVSAAALLLPASLWLLRVAIDKARRQGTLAQY